MSESQKTFQLASSRKPRREYVPGQGYVLVEPRPVEVLSAQGRKGALGNAPYERPQAKPLSRRDRRRARHTD